MTELSIRISGAQFDDWATSKNKQTKLRRSEVLGKWAGPIERGAAPYCALSGPSLLIESDNTQDGANHIHSVWRDLRRDFAGDLLAQHYAGVRPLIGPCVGIRLGADVGTSGERPTVVGIRRGRRLPAIGLRTCLRCAKPSPAASECCSRGRPAVRT